MLTFPKIYRDLFYFKIFEIYVNFYCSIVISIVVLDKEKLIISKFSFYVSIFSKIYLKIKLSPFFVNLAVIIHNLTFSIEKYFFLLFYCLFNCYFININNGGVIIWFISHRSTKTHLILTCDYKQNNNLAKYTKI